MKISPDLMDIAIREKSKTDPRNEKYTGISRGAAVYDAKRQAKDIIEWLNPKTKEYEIINIKEEK
jgi:hypothetical protein